LNEPHESPAQKPRWGWWSSFLPSIRAELLAALTWIPFVGLLAGLPWIARKLDRVGLPGGAIALGAVLVVGALAAFSAFRLLRWPSAALFRRRASGLGLLLSTGDEVELDGLPFALFGSDRSDIDFANVARGERGGSTILVFDCRRAAGEWLEAPRWHSCAAAMVPARFADVLVEPVHDRMPLAERAGLHPVTFESQEFNRAFRVWAADRWCASAVVDERMMAWLLDAKPRYGLEVSDRYLMVFRPERRSADLAERIDLLFRARGHLSRAARSLYPSVDPCEPVWPWEHPEESA
jgi:hypothetical protein